jgi:hypothetical protein
MTLTGNVDFPQLRCTISILPSYFCNILHFFVRVYVPLHIKSNQWKD